MASDKVALQSVDAHGRFMGFGNFFHKENAELWRGRRWLVRAIVWLLIINGIVLSVVKAPPQPGVPPDQQASGVMIFVIMDGLVSGIGIIIAMQGAVLDEKKSGTAAWVLSKPLSRAAFILAKLLANALGALFIMVVLQGIVAFGILSALDPHPPALLPFIGGVVLLMLHLLFYLTFTLMLSTLFNERGPVIGIPLGLLSGAQLVAGFAPGIVPFTPWPLVMPLGVPDALAAMVIRGQTLPTIIPIVATVIWIVIFIAVAVWRFGRDEF